MPDVVHGTRAAYKRGCACLPCRAANAAYVQHYRRTTTTGKRLLGSRIPAARTHILMRALRAEMSRAELARRLGWHANNYARVQHAATVTLRQALKVLRLYRAMQGEPDRPAPLDAVRRAVAFEILNELGKN